MNRDDQTSLNKLYQNRKNSIKAPSSLTHRLVYQTPKKSSWTRWSVALPTVMASLLVVVIIWPNAQTTLDTALYSESTDNLFLKQALSEDEGMQEEMSATFSASADVKVMAEQESSVSYLNNSTASMGLAPEPAQRTAVATKEARSAIQAAAPAEMPKQATAKLAAAPALASTRDEVEREQPSQLQDQQPSQLQDQQQLLLLRVINGPQGEFMNCEEEQVMLNVEVEFTEGTWLNASVLQGNDWQFEVLTTSPCQ